MGAQAMEAQARRLAARQRRGRRRDHGVAGRRGGVHCVRGRGDVGAAVPTVSLPIHDERIVEVAERIDGLTESEQEAALAALAPSDREQVLLVMLTQAKMVEQLLGLLVAGLPSEARASPADDPLRGAEQQMAERYSEAVQ